MEAPYVLLGGLVAVAGLSVLRAKTSRSFAEIESLESLEPEATYVGERKAMRAVTETSPPLAKEPRYPGVASELLAADGSRVKVGRGLSLLGGILSTEAPKVSPRYGSDVFLL